MALHVAPPDPKPLLHVPLHAQSSPAAVRSMSRVVRGTLFSVAMRWTDRLIGVVSTVVLARLLLPQDFGIIAMASLAISLVDLLLDLSVRATLVQNPAPTQAHFDTAWTLGLLQATLVALVLIVVAPCAARYFHEPRVGPVVWVLALAMLVSGAENIGVVNFQKEMEFGREYQLLFCRRFAGFAVTLASAWMLRSYWALVAGTLAGRLTGVVCSYAMHSMRPRLSLQCWREILGVSKWLLARTSACFFEAQLHRAVVGRHNSPATMGAYAMASDISSLPSTELLMPISRVLFPAFVQVKHRPHELKRVFLLAQGVQSLFAMPASAGLAMVAPQLVPLMLGQQWAGAVPLVRILALAYLASAMLYSTTCLFITLERVRVLALFIWAQVAVFALLAFGIFGVAQAEQVAWLRLGVGIVCDMGLVALLLHVFEPLRLRDMREGVQRPVLATLAMAAGLWLLDLHWAADPGDTTVLAGYARLATTVLVGSVLYGSTLALLWRLGGQPAGAEAYVLGHLKTMARLAWRKQQPCN